MSMLPEEIQNQVREILDGLQNPVRLLYFTQNSGAIECTMCSETRQLVEEVAALSDKVIPEVRDFLADEQLAAQYKVDKIPGIVVLRDGPQPVDYGIRLYGIPSGYEFSSFIEDLLLVSSGETGLSQQTLTELEKLDRPVHIQVFITPT